MKKSHNFTCIQCPLSCQIELIEEEGKILEVKDNLCKLGEKYAIAEFTNPVRILTTTAYIQRGILPMLPIRSEKPIPKNLMMQCMKELAKIRVTAPIKCGDIVCENILNTGINIIASRDLPEER
jgi:CxxC motif-containing protein